MSKVIAVASQKGGTAKSTTCRNVATILKYMGYKVLVVDCDNQANLTDCFGVESPDKLDVTLYNVHACQDTKIKFLSYELLSGF